MNEASPATEAERRALEANWIDKLAEAEAMVPLIGNLYRHKNVVTSLFGRPLIGESAISILKAHRFARRIGETELPTSETLLVLEALDRLDLGPCSIDVAELAQQFRGEGPERSLDAFLLDELSLVMQDNEHSTLTPGRDVVLYGFGRIGRMLARILIERAGDASPVTLRAVVVKSRGEGDILKRASLLRRDSVHGPFKGTISVDVDRNTILANGTLIQFIYSDSPATIDYTAYGIHDAIVVDNTGKWRDEEGLSRHLDSAGASRVLLTAPGKGRLKNIVHGINDATIADDDRIVSAASCTTNAITPVLKALIDEYGIEHGHVETVHSFTNDQNLVDNYHPGDRRGRAAGLNMVITATGAAKAAEKALPELAGKLTGNAVRVPTPNVSLAILNLTLDRAVTKDDINAYLRTVSLTAPLRRQIDYIASPEIVSTDFLGSRRAGIVDGLATIADGGRNVVVYVWYDNESGYSRQVFRVLEEMTGARATAMPLTNVAVTAP